MSQQPTMFIEYPLCLEHRNRAIENFHSKESSEFGSTSCVVNSISSSWPFRVFSTTKNVTHRFPLCQFLRWLTAKNLLGLEQFWKNILNSLYELKKMSICHIWSIIFGLTRNYLKQWETLFWVLYFILKLSIALMLDMLFPLAVWEVLFVLLR